jgi:hypothetical protein
VARRTKHLGWRTLVRLLTSRSRRALKAVCRAGMVGIAGRESTDIRWFSSTHMRTKRTLAV